ncbi:MAG: hypothetical protein AB1638_06390, partial [Nitrospirota bacterium]
DLWDSLTRRVLFTLPLFIFGLIIYAVFARLWLSGGDRIFDRIFISTIFHPLVGLSFAMMMVPLLNLPEKVNLIMRFKPITFIGIISYSIYVWHIFLLKVLSDLLHIDNSCLRAGLVMTISIAISVGFSSLSYYFIEKNFLRFKRK